MFFHNFKYSLKVLLKNKALLFWTFIFPIVLGTFYNMAFSNIEKSEKMSVMDIAIVESDNFNDNQIYKEAFNSLSDKNNDDRLFNITYTNLGESKKLLEENKIVGYLVFDESDINITVNSNGDYETILKIAVDEITSEKKIYETLVKKEVEGQVRNGNYNIDYEKIMSNITEKIKSSDVKIKNITSNNISYTMIEYYNLVAMASLYGALISMFIVNKKLANMDSVGKRTSISSIKKGSMLISSLLASYIVQLMGLLLLFLYTIFVIKVDYGNNLWLVLLLASAGSLAGLSLGVAIATLIKTHEGAKTGILIAITMTWCFLAGMTGITMKYVIDKNIAILNIINPANMITDGFYALYYYDTLNRFYFYIISLFVFSIIMILISLRGLRREQYDSI